MKMAYIVGGNPTINKRSSVILKLARGFLINFNIKTFNGTFCDDISESDLTLWMIDVDNSVDKIYPKKKDGSVLICSKVIRDGITKFDAVSRIFKMNGNSVICIYKDLEHFEFELVDALGNTWGKRTSDINELCKTILKFYKWSSSQVRKQTDNIPKVEDELININKLLSIKVQNSIGSRYFGNVSTRCMKLFPSSRLYDNLFYVSARNSNKEFLTSDDFVRVTVDSDHIFYDGERKPSVDTPIQVHLYKHFGNINYMIHGHAFIDGAEYTGHYYPCGDMREFYCILESIESKNVNSFKINLLNHGFLIGSSNLENLSEIVGNMSIIQKEILL